MAESPSIATVVSAMLCCDLVSILFYVFDDCTQQYIHYLHTSLFVKVVDC